MGLTASTLPWWSFLCAVSVLNLLAWGASTARLWRRRGTCHAPTWSAVRVQMVLSAGYVLGCAYRSVFPVYDVQRLCMVDSWLSSVAVGRSVATLAELCFAAQWALLLQGVGHATGSAAAVRSGRAVVPLIVLAELCSWYAVLTTSNLGHVVEESIWAFCAVLLVANLGAVRARCQPALRSIVTAVCVLGAGYIAYMVWVDVPMYWARWVHDIERGRPYLSVAQGLGDASARWVVSHRWEDWQSEVAWMSLYFSVGVWLSVGMMHLPGRWALRRRWAVNLATVPTHP